ncbi:MAG: tRNA preQ1(34) S-adenosylmethionine ribosyltransferase-isomerase QueA [Candidatus Omnitrophica bacterium]|nr:tRNA preQ1(34) S-adenosylmethionine ribosyltransferase-isomerase QueA [Candidatus Omnitrophota bacterium]
MTRTVDMSQFDFKLPQERIALFPAGQRSGSRLLTMNRADGRLSHTIFSALGSFFNEGDVLVLNNTKVIPARLFGRKAEGGKKIELFLLEEEEGETYRVLARPARNLNAGDRIAFGNGRLIGEVISATGENGEANKKRVRFYAEGDCYRAIRECGSVPLPPYIKRPVIPLDRERYQTVYAEKDGAVAAPTAGLHFTTRLLDEIAKGGVRIVYLTLHVGYGTFKPVTGREIASGRLEAERLEIPDDTAQVINRARRDKKRIIAVGTTTVRALESAAYRDPDGAGYLVSPSQGRTGLFIYPPYEFKVVDGLVTNFHLPRSSLFMLVCAFAGTEAMQRAYQEAITRGYRFYSYGDAMYIV